jgi:hypothetical protein
MAKPETDFVRPDGSVPFGYFHQPVGLINYRDFKLRRPTREPAPVEDREKQFVHFQFMGFTSATYIAGCSLTDSHTGRTLFFYLFNRETGQVFKRGCRLRAGDMSEISLNADDGVSHVAGRNLSATFTACVHTGRKQLVVVSDEVPLLHMSFSELDPPFQTLRLCTPTGASGWTYCQKVAGIRAKGFLNDNGKKTDLADINATAHHDFTAGFLRRKTFWNWACVTGRDAAGHIVGVNLSNGVNETGHSENMLWLDGLAQPLGLVQFNYDLDDLRKDWRLTSAQPFLDLTFTAEGAYVAHQPDGPLPVDFHQLFGHFSGVLTDQDGHRIRLDKTPGFCERQYSVWWNA